MKDLPGSSVNMCFLQCNSHDTAHSKTYFPRCWLRGRAGPCPTLRGVSAFVTVEVSGTKKDAQSTHCMVLTERERGEKKKKEKGKRERTNVNGQNDTGGHTGQEKGKKGKGEQRTRTGKQKPS